jgi:hypothetical protein
VDYEELSPGNVIRYNDDDEDGDGTLDYADEDPLQAPDTALEKITVRWSDPLRADAHDPRAAAIHRPG